MSVCAVCGSWEVAWLESVTRARLCDVCAEDGAAAGWLCIPWTREDRDRSAWEIYRTAEMRLALCQSARMDPESAWRTRRGAAFECDSCRAPVPSGARFVEIKSGSGSSWYSWRLCEDCGASLSEDPKAAPLRTGSGEEIPF